MMLTDFAIWSFSVFGLSMILAISKIFRPFREWILIKLRLPKIYDMLRCPMCNAFWIGICFHIFWKDITRSFFLDGLIASGVTLFLYCICWDLALKDKEF